MQSFWGQITNLYVSECFFFYNTVKIKDTIFILQTEFTQTKVHGFLIKEEKTSSVSIGRTSC